MSKPTPGIAFNLDAKNLVVTTAVVTTTAIVTTGALHVVAAALIPPVKKLARKLEKENEERKNK